MKTNGAVTASLMAVAALLVAGCGARDKADRPADAASTSEPGMALPRMVETPSGIKMAYIPAGSFRMGSEDGADDEKPVREVTISEPLYMDVALVRQGHFEELIGFNPARFFHHDRPVEQVRWHEAAEYCNARSRAEGLTPAYNEETWDVDFDADGYRLPTEAEWEYAARAGTSTTYFYGNRSTAGDPFVWARENANRSTQEHAKRPNPWGVSDLLGHLWEWCNDAYDATYYATGPSVDPRGPESGDWRVLRGGAWDTAIRDCRPSTRRPDDPANADICAGYDTYGFRVVRRATPWPGTAEE